MGDIEFKLSSPGVRQLLNTQSLMDGMQAIGERMASEAGEGYEADTKPGKKRAHTFVKAVTPHAYYSNLKHNTLLKVLHE